MDVTDPQGHMTSSLIVGYPKDTLLYPPDASGGYYGFRGGTPPPPQCVDNFSLPSAAKIISIRGLKFAG